VVRSTALLKALHEKYPRAQVTWVTEAPADQILRGHPQIDRVFTLSPRDLLQLSALEFDVALVIDKSLIAAGLLEQVKVSKVYGFGVDAKTGGTRPLNRAAVELWELGLDNEKKFFKNQKSEIQLVHEALELKWFPDNEYDLPLALKEDGLRAERHQRWQVELDQPVIGLNTGCSDVIPSKKWTVETHRQVIRSLLARGYRNLVLLGGPEDRERNLLIAQGLPVFPSPTDMGLRDGLVSVAACDLVITGDSLGMHMAISQKKYITAWFGPTCAQEIELYGRGDKVLTKAPCAPCWKRSCGEKKMCYDQVDLSQVMESVEKGRRQWNLQQDQLKQHQPKDQVDPRLSSFISDDLPEFSSSRRPFSETSY